MTKTIVVSGTATGMGRATVNKFAAEGWNVVATVRKESDLQTHSDGTADRILPIEATGARTHEMVKDSQYVVIEDAPHGCIWTHADEVNRALLEFIGAAAPNSIEGGAS